MSLRTCADIEKHLFYVANGITGLTLLKDGIKIPEVWQLVDQFSKYVDGVKSYSIEPELISSPRHPVVTEFVAECLKHDSNFANAQLGLIKKKTKILDKINADKMYAGTPDKDAVDLTALINDAKELYNKLIALYHSARGL